MSGETVLVRLGGKQQQAPLFLELRHDPHRRRPAFARAGAVALEYLGEVTDGLRAPLEEIRRHVARASGSPAQVADRLCSAFELVEPWRAWPERFIPPQPWLEGHCPLLAGVAPALPELELLDLRGPGPRRLVKRELGVEADVRRFASAWREVALPHVIVPPPRGGPWVLLGADDPEILRQAREHEAHLDVRDEGSAAAIRWMGDHLGYPSCCVEAFLRLGRRDDFSAAACLIPPWPHAPAPPETQWLDPFIRLSSHFPCEGSCAGTRARAVELLALAEHARSGTAAAWRELTARVHVIDAKARHLSLELDGEDRIVRAMLHDGPAGSFAVAPLIGPHLGARALPHRGGLRSEDGSLVGVLVADHRGTGAPPP